MDSVLNQDVPTEVWLFDNGSTDGTLTWARESLPTGSPIIHHPDNMGVSFGWNTGLTKIFEHYDHAFVVNNDVILPPWALRSLLEYNVPFVTGVSVDNLAAIAETQPRKGLVEAPDFSFYLIRRNVWEKVGPFDESMIMYAQDNDFHVRAHHLGISLLNSGVHFYHERSSTIKNADKREQRELCLQADADREVFRTKYNCLPWEPKYAELFK